MQSILKIYRILCRLGEVEALLDLPRCFERSLVRQSRNYVVIGVTDVKDYILGNINFTSIANVSDSKKIIVFIFLFVHSISLFDFLQSNWLQQRAAFYDG